MVEVNEDVRREIKRNIETVFFLIAGESAFDNENREEAYKELKLIVVDELAKADEKYSKMERIDLLLEGMEKIAEAKVKMKAYEMRTEDDR